MSKKAHLTRRCVLRVATAACAFPDIVRACLGVKEDIALRLGRQLRWDPQGEEFGNDIEANRMLSRAWRSPWRL